MTIEQKAEERFPTQPEMVDTEQEYIENSNAKHGFIMGAYYMLGKAVKWLQENADGYTWHNPVKGESGMYEEFITDFRKAMRI